MDDAQDNITFDCARFGPGWIPDACGDARMCVLDAQDILDCARFGPGWIPDVCGDARMCVLVPVAKL